MLSMQPTTTGSATAISLIYPELKGKLNGHAVRAPAENVTVAPPTRAGSVALNGALISTLPVK